MKAVNVSRSIIVGSDIREARGFFSRLRGLIGKDRLEEGEGLWINNCRAIHTFGMRFPIDVVFLDKDNVVKKAVEGLRPSHPNTYCLSARGVLELPEGTIERAQVRVGNRIEIKY